MTSLPRERRPIPLNIILGPSPANCRHAVPVDDEIDGLAATMVALESLTGEPLIQPLVVGAVPGPRIAFHVHAGRRRWIALRRLVDAGTFKADRPVDCLVLAGDDAAIAAEISLAENTVRRDLHPVDQCDAFAALRDAGRAVEAIAADFAIPLRQVRQRLRLTKLSPAVRESWRAGRMTLEQAQAFAIADSHDVQDELLGRIAQTLPRHSAGNIRTELEHALKAVSFDTREARYVGLDAYRAAGGRVEEDLFADVPLIFDEPLLKRLARERMMAAGAAIAEAEGWAFCFAMEDSGAWQYWDRVAPDYTAAERARLDAITDEGEALEGDDEEAWAAMARLDAEESAILARGLARVPAAKRERAGILLAIDPDGRLDVTRGLVQPKPEPERAAPPTSPKPDSTKLASTKSAAKPEKPADPIKAAAAGLGQVRAVLDEAAREGLARVVAARPDLALTFAVARFGGTYAPEHLEREFGLAPEGGFGRPSKRDGLLGRLDGKHFGAAIALCADAAVADLTVAFAAIAARSIRLGRNATLAGLEPVARAFARRGAALGPAFRTAFDPERYFAVATKAAALAALDAMAATNIERAAKKEVVAAHAAAEAKAKGWLPHPLAAWSAIAAESPEADVGDEGAAEPSKPLAQAMGEAIDGDELRREIGLLTFLTMNVVERPGAVLSRNALASAYRNAQPVNPYNAGEVEDILFELGMEAETSDGVGAVYNGFTTAAGGDA